jgi:hypothetical protein
MCNSLIDLLKTKRELRIERENGESEGKTEWKNKDFTENMAVRGAKHPPDSI